MKPGKKKQEQEKTFDSNYLKVKPPSAKLQRRIAWHHASHGQTQACRESFQLDAAADACKGS